MRARVLGIFLWQTTYLRNVAIVLNLCLEYQISCTRFLNSTAGVKRETCLLVTIFGYWSAMLCLHSKIILEVVIDCGDDAIQIYNSLYTDQGQAQFTALLAWKCHFLNNVTWNEAPLNTKSCVVC